MKGIFRVAQRLFRHVIIYLWMKDRAGKNSLEQDEVKEHTVQNKENEKGVIYNGEKKKNG